MHRSIRHIIVVTVAVINVFFYRYIFIRNLPLILVSSIRTDLLAVNSTTPLLISVPQSFTTKIKIAILKEFCSQPVLGLRLVGPEIYYDILNNTDLISSINDNVYVIQYDVPSSLLLGEYNVEVSLLHCGTVRSNFAISNESCVIESHWSHIINIGSQSSNATTISSSWVLAPKCKSSESRSPECYESGDSTKQTDYIYMEIDRETNTALYNNLITIQDGITLSLPPSLSGSSSDTSLIKSFEQLSNYELVCWLGDDDAQQYYRAFMSLYPLISNGQRPFKFKYLELKDVIDIAKDSSQTDTYKKCKIIFISYGVDRFDAGITAETYGAEVQTVLNYIRKTHSDERYDRSAWFLSPRSSMSEKDNGCTNSAATQGRTPFRIHSAINKLHNIFNEKQVNRIDQAEPHIHFMDNSDITESLSHISNEIDTSYNQHIMDLQISSVVAMRCMEKIAQTVKNWRYNRQQGTINGVMKDGKLIPNSELF